MVEMLQKQFIKNKYFNKVKTLERATIIHESPKFKKK